MGPRKKKAGGGGGGGGDPSAGEKIFKNLCSACHTLSAHSTGPALGGLVGTNIASQDSFSYSAALAGKATLKWSEGNLDKWFKSPADFAPGNGMAFAGIAAAKDRQDLIAFLRGG
jgi:cytochrome c